MTLKIAAFLVVCAVAVSAQTPATGDRIYQAIRSNDLAALRTLVAGRGVEAADSQGQTPLMLAAAFGSRDAVRLLLERGASASASTGAGLAPLHLAVMDAGKVRMLLDAGADVKAAATGGRTPLIIAASTNGSAEVVRLLLARGADVNQADATGVTPLVAATNVNDTETVKLLLERGANPARVSTAEGISTPLTGAARNGNAELVRLLLSKNVDVNAIGAEQGPKVKNGVIQFGRVTALHLGAVSGNEEVVRLLLASGAAVDPLDVRGMTPLMFAIATDRPNPRIIRLLLDAGAKVSLPSAAGETVVDWARKFNNPLVLGELKLPPVQATASAAQREGTRRVLTALMSPREAVGRSLPVLQTTSRRMMSDGGCIACHAQPLVGIATNLAHARGWTAAPADDTDVVLTFVNARAAQLMQLRDGGGLPDGLVYSTLLLAADRRPPSAMTDAVVHFLAAKQRQEGNWRGVGGTRAPIQDGDFSRTALAIRALTVYATPARAGEYASRVKRAVAWLAAQRPVSTEDRVMQLLGLHWAGAEPRLRQGRMRELIGLQRADGGWSQTPHLASDAYATGQALYTLRELGTPATDAALQRGAAFLLRTQQEDGTWHVVNRAMKIQPYFDSGFPYEHDQWISASATAWATMGLTVTAVETAPVQARR